MAQSNRRLHVIIGTGALGLAVMRELLTRGERVRLVNRSGRREPSWTAEMVQADVTNPEEAKRACRGASVVYHCSQPPYAQWPEKAPPVMRGIIEGASAAGATLVYGDNLYMYGKAPMPLIETLPHAPVGPNTRTRAELAEMLLAAHQQGRVRMAIGRGSDFYGPFALSSTMGERVFPNALKGKAAQLLGDPDLPHTYTFIDDFGKALVILGERDEALGQVWHVPSGETRSTREFVQMVFEEANQQPKLSTLPSWFMRLLGIFNPTLRAVGEVLYQAEHPWVMDSSKFVHAFGDISTPHREAIRRTLAWYREQTAQLEGRPGDPGRSAAIGNVQPEER